ncbi:hypothetical protein TTRE_0000559101 [Trichuris trichiura]|uniref:Uncharacterized protein n=1 Tax=Trichuris trichiura TaxID=36087 RepID=A0A077ZF91_TRITR|nr:hypothetical protein TTRE_0000559101 [Trichuris trichiura]
MIKMVDSRFLYDHTQDARARIPRSRKGALIEGMQIGVAKLTDLFLRHQYDVISLFVDFMFKKPSVPAMPAVATKSSLETCRSDYLSSRGQPADDGWWQLDFTSPDEIHVSYNPRNGRRQFYRQRLVPNGCEALPNDGFYPCSRLTTGAQSSPTVCLTYKLVSRLVLGAKSCALLNNIYSLDDLLLRRWSGNVQSCTRVALSHGYLPQLTFFAIGNRAHLPVDVSSVTSNGSLVSEASPHLNNNCIFPAGRLAQQLPFGSSPQRPTALYDEVYNPSKELGKGPPPMACEKFAWVRQSPVYRSVNAKQQTIVGRLSNALKFSGRRNSWFDSGAPPKHSDRPSRLDKYAARYPSSIFSNSPEEENYDLNNRYGSDSASLYRYTFSNGVPSSPKPYGKDICCDCGFEVTCDRICVQRKVYHRGCFKCSSEVSGLRVRERVHPSRTGLGAVYLWRATVGDKLRLSTERAVNSRSVHSCHLEISLGDVMNWVWSWSDYIYQGLCVCGQSNVYAFGEADPNIIQ